MSCYGVYVMAHDDDVRVVSSPEESHQGYSTDPQKIHTHRIQDTEPQPIRREARGEKKRKKGKGDSHSPARPGPPLPSSTWDFPL
jgi:hypothetical protein